MSVSAITTENIARHADPRSVALYSRDAGLWPIEQELTAEFVSPPFVAKRPRVRLPWRT